MYFILACSFYRDGEQVHERMILCPEHGKEWLFLAEIP
jgi:hypothetical protein